MLTCEAGRWAASTALGLRGAARVQKKKRGTLQTKAISAARLDEVHDSGEDLSDHLNLAKATRPGREIQRVNVDFPVDLLRAIDREAKRIGVTRQASRCSRRLWPAVFVAVEDQLRFPTAGEGAGCREGLPAQTIMRIDLTMITTRSV
jgi:hypothetical protein